MSTSLDYEDVRRRADLYDCIAEMIRSTSSMPMPRTGEAGVSENAKPRVSVIDRRVVCNGRALDLARRPLTLRLFQAFCSAPEHRLARETVIDVIYGAGGSRLSDTRTPRYVDSLHTNAIKLISRARTLATAYLGQALPPGSEWFVYSQEQRCWQLYRS